MKIVFLTRYDPKDINHWSGTLYHMYHQLKKEHHVEIIGTEILCQHKLFVNRNFNRHYFLVVDRHTKNIGQLLSERINILQFDLVFFGDLLFQPLNINIPFIHFSDITFEQVNIHLRKCNERNIEFGIHLEDLIKHYKQYNEVHRKNKPQQSLYSNVTISIN